METKFLFFVALNEGSLHNCLFDDIQLLLDALKYLTEQEAEDDKILNFKRIKQTF
jgi:hypothetical protein